MKKNLFGEWRVALPRRAAACVITIAVTGGCAHFVSPQGAAIPDRPGYTDGPLALPAGAVELEAGLTDDNAGSVEYTTYGEVLLRVGIGARTELRLFGNSYATRAETGVPRVDGTEDPKIGVKTNVHTKPDSIHSLVPNLALLAAVTVPAGATSFRNDHAQPEAKLAASWTTPTPFSVYSNVGWGAVYDGLRWGQRGWASVALWYLVNPRVSLFGEGIALRSLQGSALPSNAADVGIIYLINDRFQLDVRAGHGIGRASGSERFFGAGFARRW